MSQQSPAETGQPAGQISEDAVVLLAGTVLTPDPAPGVAGLLAQGGLVHRLLGSREEAPPGARLYDLGPEAVLLPGLIDVHTHGGWN
ncbi:MAG TPA: hypothetical protein VHQ00_07095, partial [Chloroflexota bacterium]|nr:hypothetical protein [Chloroflexota bacterium]